MVDKAFCLSSYLALRFIEKPGIDFTSKYRYRYPEMPSSEGCIKVNSAEDISDAITVQLDEIRMKHKKTGILLSGGMDSGILASYLPGADAYTFRFLGGEYQKEELSRAEMLADRNGMTLHYVDIDWNTVKECLKPVMESKGGPVHSIEPQVYKAALQAKSDGVDLMIIGDASDYIFGGMDKLLSVDWTFEDFIKRYIYVDPFDVLVDPVSIDYVFEDYRKGRGVDTVKVIEMLAAQESYGSYENAFHAACLEYFDPYEKLIMAEPLDISRIRNGQSKYLIRELFKMRYNDIEVLEKIPMPRPVNAYFSDWNGPKRPEFRKDIDISRFDGNQKWLMWSLEEFLNMIE